MRILSICLPAVLAAPLMATSTTPFERAPEPVRHAVMHEFSNATVEQCRRLHARGNETYEVTLTSVGQRWRVRLTPDGRIIEESLVHR